MEAPFFPLISKILSMDSASSERIDYLQEIKGFKVLGVTGIDLRYGVIPHGGYEKIVEDGLTLGFIFFSINFATVVTV